MQSGSKNWTIGKQRQQQNEQIKTKTKTNKKHTYIWLIISLVYYDEVWKNWSRVHFKI